MPGVKWFFAFSGQGRTIVRLLVGRLLSSPVQQSLLSSTPEINCSFRSNNLLESLTEGSPVISRQPFCASDPLVRLRRALHSPESISYTTAHHYPPVSTLSFYLLSFGRSELDQYICGRIKLLRCSITDIQKYRWKSILIVNNGSGWSTQR